ncbi:FAD-dependent oxidoreductase [Paenalcaligenes niemegkensis]|uniref:FAD-dependent oxidoreductase n=1 Tax=Paenalcaligenes niemegkensis TaxID=2895469 RepID=UPI001EE7A60D|nr:FAD-dependent oxidoreductase [Paenalcaligenes niemegkensis]MCQ9615633.1 FAD-dependent oxidoreductase [Paenalcaligenes niemegkensis]
MLIPKKDMSRLWLEKALADVDVRLGQRVQKLNISNDYVRVDNEVFDACILATPAYAAARLLATIDGTNDSTSQQWIATMSHMAHRPIATVYLEPASPWQETQPLLMLHENRQQHDYGQWLFNHHAIPGSFARSLLSVVISDAEALSALPREQAITAVESQVRRQLASRAPLDKIVNAELIIEKRATFEASPFTTRATEITPWPSVFLAGDWLQNEYPGVLEGAVRSGLKSARLLLAQSAA